MKQTVVWPIAAVAALGIVVLGIATVEAQRGGDRPAPAPAPRAGRFVVAHALAERVVILDTATGQLYVAGERDMKRFSELPRVGEGRPMFLEKDKDAPPRISKEKSRFDRKEREKDEDVKKEDPR